MRKTRAMRVTTVRFSDDLWATVEREAALAGVSASQFVREAALARAAAAAGARGELPFASFSATVDHLAGVLPADKPSDVQRALATLLRASAASTRSDGEALRAQSAQTKLKSRELVRRPKRPI
jgi:uncharacterized protein (DUF1778 family)